MYIIDSEIEYKKCIKNSIFITHAKHVHDIEQAIFFLKNKKNHKATHNCWAYRIGEKIKFFDDNEPYGTAGKQILNAILAHEFDFICILISRWFGGIKLGTKLSKAYFTCTSECLKNGKKSEIEINEILNIKLNISFFKYFSNWLQNNNIKILSKIFEYNMVYITIQIEKTKIYDFRNFEKSLYKK
ncbi:IMPACT family member YigZ [Candidatus Kinetoplastibacterium sorsogonicusi]|uniref:IMPACT family member YigZ n=1 Tax=Candidatus Kinetoplastidibacterium kentomonadis TaxID=1576550 RepID=A0A3Q8ER81_9PROT|nr:YigZ family protein [Candidatus Kinetoplastibacterium sorsogonicusi]AWD32372.1 IMPACT family member YigZ [Candidatus Kinetoplastibacterium sorsogonicusi]